MRRPTRAFLAGVLLALGACGSSSSTPGDGGIPDAPPGPGIDAGLPDAPPAIGPEALGTNASGIAIDGFAASATIGAGGGAVALTGGARVELPGGALASPVAIGLRPAASPPPALTDGRQLLGGWTDVAASVNDLVLHDGKHVTLSLPIAPPGGATAPALHLLARATDGVLYPIDGVYDAQGGRFVVELQGLPPLMTVAAVHLPSMRRETSDALPAAKPDWPTVNFSIDYDGNVVTIEQARRVLRFARTAAQRYSEAGLREPFLYRSAPPAVPRWQLHLVPADGSYFDSNHDVASEDVEERFGRLYVDVSRIDALSTAPLGSLQASIAHEMLHAVFFNYQVPHRCLNVVQNGVTMCLPTDRGFDEGMATATGYMIDQGVVKPRLDEQKLKLSLPPGIVSATLRKLAYSNQDFMVYVLRKNGLSGIRALMEGLAATPPLPATGSSYTVLDAYHRALQAGGVGTGESFLAFYAGYVFDRGYVHTSAGRIWPDEPTSVVPYSLDPALFGAPRAVAAGECGTASGESACAVTMTTTCPMCAYAFTIDLAAGVGVPAGMTRRELLGTFTAAGLNSAIHTAIAAFGETGGQGVAESQARGIDAAATLGGMWQTYGKVTLLALQHGGVTSSLFVSSRFAAADAVRAMTRGTLRLGPILQTMRATGTSPGCGASGGQRQAFYQFDVQDGTWNGDTYSGSYDHVFPPGSFGGHRRSQISYSVTLDASATHVVGFVLDTTLTALDDESKPASTNVVHIRWTGGPIALVSGGLYKYTFQETAPITDANIDLDDVFSVVGEDCALEVIKNEAPELSAAIVGLTP